MQSYLPTLLLLLAQGVSSLPQQAAEKAVPAPPSPEPIKLQTLPLPPAIADDAGLGDCNLTVNPKGTGCTGKTLHLGSGSFLPDGKHILVQVTFVGAPAAPDKASIYAGTQLIAVKTDGTKFPNGDPWKCLSCGVYREKTEELEYPQAFRDGKRALGGSSILDCGKYDLVDSRCTPQVAKWYSIRWNTNTDGSGPGGDIRELRLHPDNVHLGFNSFTQVDGKLGQNAYFSKLSFNPSPKTGLPLGPRYDLLNVTLLFDPNGPQPVEVKGDELVINPGAITMGELRGFTGDGKEVTYVGYPAESSNIDAFAVDLTTGAVRRLTSHPEYIDPLDFSSDSKWFVAIDTRGTDRQMWLSAMRHIPPITDLVSTSVTSATRNNGRRRFFRPYLLDKYGDRGNYYGQRLNDQGSGVAGSGDYNDPEWNARADPRWSPDGTQVVWWDEITLSPACGGQNPLPCYPSKEPGGRAQRVVVATLTSRKPYAPVKVNMASDIVPWGIRYTPGSTDLARPQPPAGNYTLRGKHSGYAKVQLQDNSSGSLSSVSVEYVKFSDDGKFVLNGTESVKTTAGSATLTLVDWRSDLVQTVGGVVNTKETSPGGFQLSIDVLINIFNANGTLTTKVDGKTYHQPANGT
ncbi:Hypothetical protein NCS54_00951200 [Fusarium falciforme]|uniref:Hypothetical protein n=1 Tax=Fusarium falciforme TaxID=195108 RepID=UPI002301F1F4|nr:Hypothetical protein NCS54_00951200 [Fusarium falciforme]WAO92022.1 Hypothetical protein NCS54_00951200 [Fusarium falciforme]